MLQEFSLEGRFALVTGGSKGLGYAMAGALARAGAEVAITSRHGDELSAAANRLAKETSRCVVPVVADVTSAEQVEAMTAEVVEAFGRLDVLVNNAGINVRNPTIKQTEEEFRRIIDTNLVGAFLGAILVSVVLIPVLGIVATCLAAAILKVSSLALVGALAPRD